MLLEMSWGGEKTRCGTTPNKRGRIWIGRDNMYKVVAERPALRRVPIKWEGSFAVRENSIGIAEKPAERWKKGPGGV